MQRGIDRSLSLTLFYERINKMTYIELINAFEKWLETNHLPSVAQLLWYKLVSLFNKAMWSEWITVDNYRLMALLDVKREATFISYKKGSPNRYKICTVNFESTNSSINSSTNSSKKRSTNSSRYRRHNR